MPRGLNDKEKHELALKLNKYIKEYEASHGEMRVSCPLAKAIVDYKTGVPFAEIPEFDFNDPNADVYRFYSRVNGLKVAGVLAYQRLSMREKKCWYVPQKWLTEPGAVVETSAKSTTVPFKLEKLDESKFDTAMELLLKAVELYPYHSIKDLYEYIQNKYADLFTISHKDASAGAAAKTYEKIFEGYNQVKIQFATVVSDKASLELRGVTLRELCQLASGQHQVLGTLPTTEAEKEAEVETHEPADSGTIEEATDSPF